MELTNDRYLMQRAELPIDINVFSPLFTLLNHKVYGNMGTYVWYHAHSTLKCCRDTGLMAYSRQDVYNILGCHDS